MEHKSLKQLHDAATVDTKLPLFSERSDRLRRWAELLEREGSRRFPTLHDLELAPRSEHFSLRAKGSAIAVAFADPALRASGLAGDTYGDAKDFFGLSERQAHRLLCSCLNGPATQGHSLAVRLRTMAARRDAWHGLVRALRTRLTPIFGPMPDRVPTL